MRILVLSFIALVLVGCDERPQVTKSLPDGISIVEIDGCEYIKNLTYNGVSVYTHKGNCKYCWERLEKLIQKAEDNRNFSH